MLGEILQNPIVIGVIASIITYLYLRWDNEKKIKIDPKNTKKKISLLTPGIVGAITWYIVSNYMDMTNTTQKIVISGNPEYKNNDFKDGLGNFNIDVNKQNNFNNVDSLSLESKSYHLVGKGQISVPNAASLNNDLPEMFIELDNFT